MTVLFGSSVFVASRTDGHLLALDGVNGWHRLMALLGIVPFFG